MEKILGFFPKILWVKNTPNIEFKEQEDEISKLIQKHNELCPDEFVWGMTRNAGTTIFAESRSELKKETAWDRINYCKEKGIVHEDNPDDDRVLIRHNNHGFHFGKHEFDSKE